MTPTEIQISSKTLLAMYAVQYNRVLLLKPAKSKIRYSPIASKKMTYDKLRKAVSITPPPAPKNECPPLFAASTALL